MALLIIGFSLWLFVVFQGCFKDSDYMISKAYERNLQLIHVVFITCFVIKKLNLINVLLAGKSTNRTLYTWLRIQFLFDFGNVIKIIVFSLIKQFVI